MTGRRYYITNRVAWNRHAARFANSHWLALDSASGADAGDCARILAIVEADEGVHLCLDDDSQFEALPSALGDKSISDAAHAALAIHGVAAGATTFEAAETAGRIHPLLRHRVF
jgi:hypothetical protein